MLVKEEPVKLGMDSYKDMFPNSIWPSTLPSLPPISDLCPGAERRQPATARADEDLGLCFPSDIELIGAGTFGQDISALYNIGFSPDGAVGVGRVFVQFSNLFAWNPTRKKTARIWAVAGRSCRRTP